MRQPLIVYYIMINILTFFVWGWDKFRARLQQWRVPEKWLIALIIAGGALGGLAGMMIFHHKTRKSYFWVLVVICLILHVYMLQSLSLDN